MANYFYDLPYDIIYYIHTISSKIIIQKYISERLIKKKDFISKLIFDLYSSQSNINLDIDLNIYTLLILNNINNLFFGNEVYGDNPLIDQEIWANFLWTLYYSIIKTNILYFRVNNSIKLYNDIENIYYELRIKTSRYGLLNNGIEYLFNLPPYITMETNYDFID
jgi:hypothetical protein